MAYLREADREPRPASRDPVVAHEPGAAALQPWQAAVIAGLQAGLTAVVACAEARVSVRQFRESYTRDLLFRDACLAAIAAARAAADEVLAPARALPPWAPALFGVLLKGVSLEAAYAKVGVTAADVRRERQRNLFFRQAFQVARTVREGGDSRRKYEPLLDRAVADAVVAARAIAPREGAAPPRADWQGALLRAMRDGWPIVDATRIANIDERTVASERERNPAFAQVYDLIAIFVPCHWSAMSIGEDRSVLQVTPEISAVPPPADWPDRALAAYRAGASPLEAALAASVALAVLLRQRQIDQAFAAAWNAITRQHQAAQAQAQAAREQQWRAKQERIVAALSADTPLEVVARAEDVPLDMATAWTATIPAVAQAYAAYQQREMTRRQQSVERAAATLRGGGSLADAATAADVPVEMIHAWMRSESTLRRACAEGERVRDAALADAFLAALSAGTAPRAAAAQVGWTWKHAVRRRNQDAAFARAWQEALAQRSTTPPRQRGRTAMPPDDRTIVRREERRDRQVKALAALRGGATIGTVETAAGVSRTTLYTWMRDDRVFKAAWQAAAEQGRVVRAVRRTPAPAPTTRPLPQEIAAAEPTQAPADAREAAREIAERAPLDVAPVQHRAAQDAAEAIAGSVAGPDQPCAAEMDASPPAEESDWALGYLTALELRGSVAEACRAVDIQPKAVYDRWQTDATFRAAMNVAMAGTTRREQPQPARGRRDGRRGGGPVRSREEVAEPPPAAQRDTPQHWEVAFLDALRRGARVDQAARRAGISVSTVYEHRRQSDRFRTAWEDAQPKVGGRR